MSRFIKVEISRASYSEVYLEVPDDWDIKRWPDGPTLRSAVKETVTPDEWDPDLSGQSIEAQGIEEIAEEEAKMFTTYKVEVTT